MDDVIEVNGEQYVRRNATTGTRVVMVVDRGWMFAGDVERHDGGRVVLTRAVWIFGFKKIGFAKMVECGRGSQDVDIRPVPGGVVDLPAGSELFSVPVADEWGF